MRALVLPLPTTHMRRGPAPAPGEPTARQARLLPRQLAHSELAGVVLGGHVRHGLQQEVGDAQPLQQAGRPVAGLVRQLLEGIVTCSSCPGRTACHAVGWVWVCDRAEGSAGNRQPLPVAGLGAGAAQLRPGGPQGRGQMAALSLCPPKAVMVKGSQQVAEQPQTCQPGVTCCPPTLCPPGWG